MKWILTILAVLVALAGIVFALQGTGIVPVGGMANHIQWAYIGTAMVIVAIGLVWFAFRPGRHQGS